MFVGEFVTPKLCILNVCGQHLEMVRNVPVPKVCNLEAEFLLHRDLRTSYDSINFVPQAQRTVPFSSFSNIHSFHFDLFQQS